MDDEDYEEDEVEVKEKERGKEKEKGRVMRRSHGKQDKRLAGEGEEKTTKRERTEESDYGIMAKHFEAKKEEEKWEERKELD